jgi:hypothetical protein
VFPVAISLKKNSFIEACKRIKSIQKFQRRENILKIIRRTKNANAARKQMDQQIAASSQGMHHC